MGRFISQMSKGVVPAMALYGAGVLGWLLYQVLNENELQAQFFFSFVGVLLVSGLAGGWKQVRATRR